MESIKLPENKLDKLMIVGDRVLIKPVKQSNKTASGLYLPPSVKEKEKVQSGYVIKVGPGYPVPVAMDLEESWRGQEDKVQYIPLQAKEGDLAIFLLAGAYEVVYDEEKYFIVPQSSILMLERDESIFS
ncbi:co-chaperone GroES [Aureibacter tunicatorum]|uniref:Co-chaperonin GroES (HSP10) n=1 Tax=Aureibacter tunicatorum TaxID=866807 RepID=A0AAE3XK57_9BACT|nr:co-chaperonin GroES (HSP10) [Aureibacter tunicatorum]BDD03161.1 chaperonin [Aureibacter tunicatorum]